MSETKKRAWSLSILKLYEQCPGKYKAIKIDKIPEPESPYLSKGIAEHTKCEDFLTDKIQVLPPSLQNFYYEFHNLKKRGALAEEAIATDDHWDIIPGDSWYHPDVWLRLKLDARVDNFLVDFKTGKRYPEHEEQAELYSIVWLLNHPEIETVEVEFWYLNTGEVVTYTFDRRELTNQTVKWEERVKAFMEDTAFTPTRNKYCYNCYIRQDCEVFNKKLS